MTDVRTFCRRLDELRRESGARIPALIHNPAIGLGRSQLYATMRGEIGTPPTWEFVDAFVKECVLAARANGKRLSVSTDPEYWRHELALVVDLAERPERGRPDRSNGVLTAQQRIVRELPPSTDGRVRRLGLITGDIRQVHGIDAWVNSENTDMVMARVQDRSISAVIRYEGAERDGAGRVVVDHVADALAAKVARLQPPLVPGQVVTTGSGELARNGVRAIIHAATVYGAPGAGFTPVRELGRCVENALVAAEQPYWDPPLASVLFPLLGCGEAGGDPETVVPELIETAANRLVVAARHVEAVWFLARTGADLRVCERALDRAIRASR